MAMEGKMSVIKWLMFIFNAIFWLTGLALIILGAVLKSKYGIYLTFADGKYADAAIFLIIVGVIVFIVAFLGCCGAIKEHYCMVTTFAIFMIVIFILEVAAGALGLAYKKKVVTVADKALSKGIEKYHSEKGAEQFFDWIQEEFKCCGNNGPKDWNSTIPSSCCKSGGANSTCTEADAYQKGCKQGFEDFVKGKLVVIGAVALAFAFVQILGIIFAFLMMREIRGQYEVV
ncbi:23 kDa integral membrane protein-like [Rhopilema esculentum]|uniref:23 kDa integral membrane protein-like n=1 Tax=Rhopilema esculentum TaxID=499914 RepID=UPI0031E28B17|eukprot:gene13362-4215_t